MPFYYFEIVICLFFLSKMKYDLFLGKRFSGAGVKRGQSELFCDAKAEREVKEFILQKNYIFAL